MSQTEPTEEQAPGDGTITTPPPSVTNPDIVHPAPGESPDIPVEPDQTPDPETIIEPVSDPDNPNEPAPK